MSESPTIEVGETARQNLRSLANEIQVADRGEPLKPDVASLLAGLDEIQRAEVESEYRRRMAMQEVARNRWLIAQHVHRLKDGKTPLNWNTHPFTKALYQDDGLDTVLYGSAQFGKTELLIVDMIATAFLGWHVLAVFASDPKKLNFVATRLDPILHSVPWYKQLMDTAKKRNATSDSTRVKHVGAGQITMISANADQEFTSHDADAVKVDEYQGCKIENVSTLNTRMMGSRLGSMLRIGHPSSAGTEQNENLDWFYLNSDQRVWKIQCDTCKKQVELNWWSHVVEETYMKGGIKSTVPRDKDWQPGNRFDLRPICDECKRPINRLKEGFWDIQKPEFTSIRHGFQLSNLYNSSPMCRLDLFFPQYISARHSGQAMHEFVTKVLGKPFNMDGSKISEGLLQNCSDGQNGVPKYQFVPASHIKWNE